jgi:8-oxo-dGTP pyrophosphatase MutT (NUDIX family)
MKVRTILAFLLLLTYAHKRKKHHYAGVLLVTSSGKLIGQQRDDRPDIDNPGKVATFGGTVEAGEDYSFAAWRELVQEETNLTNPESEFELFFEDESWRPLTSEWEARHFYKVIISDETLENLEVYEGKGWAEILGPDDPNLVDAWRKVIEAYLHSIE